MDERTVLSDFKLAVRGLLDLVLLPHTTCQRKCPTYEKVQVSNACKIPPCVPPFYTSFKLSRNVVQSSAHVRAVVGKIENGEYILTSAWNQQEAGGYYLPRPCHGHRKFTSSSTGIHWTQTFSRFVLVCVVSGGHGRLYSSGGTEGNHVVLHRRQPGFRSSSSRTQVPS